MYSFNAREAKIRKPPIKILLISASLFQNSKLTINPSGISALFIIANEPVLTLTTPWFHKK